MAALIKITCCYCDKEGEFIDNVDAHKVWQIMGISINKNDFIWSCGECFKKKRETVKEYVKLGKIEKPEEEEIKE
jgi:hypothetical protein